MLEGHTVKLCAPLLSFNLFHLARMFPPPLQQCKLFQLQGLPHIPYSTWTLPQFVLFLIILFLNSYKTSLEVHIQSFQLEYKLLEERDYIFWYFYIWPNTFKKYIRKVSLDEPVLHASSFHFCYVIGFLPQSQVMVIDSILQKDRLTFREGRWVLQGHLGSCVGSQS